MKEEWELGNLSLYIYKTIQTLGFFPAMNAKLEFGVWVNVVTFMIADPSGVKLIIYGENVTSVLQFYL